MDKEQLSGYKTALSIGARKTAARIRTGEASLGVAIVAACREVGTPIVVTALLQSKNGEWSACAIRYAPYITHEERILLKSMLSSRDKEQARFARTFLHLSEEEKSVLNFICDTGPDEESF